MFVGDIAVLDSDSEHHKKGRTRKGLKYLLQPGTEEGCELYSPIRTTSGNRGTQPPMYSQSPPGHFIAYAAIRLVLHRPDTPFFKIMPILCYFILVSDSALRYRIVHYHLWVKVA